MERQTITRSLPQFMQLLETSPSHVQSQLFHALQTQNPAWAALLRTKILTPERILNWEPKVLKTVLAQHSPDTLSVLAASLEPQYRQSLLRVLNELPSLSVRARFEIESRPASDVSDGEIAAARMSFVTHVRNLEASGKLDLSQIAPMHAGFGTPAA